MLLEKRVADQVIIVTNIQSLNISKVTKPEYNMCMSTLSNNEYSSFINKYVAMESINAA